MKRVSLPQLLTLAAASVLLTLSLASLGFGQEAKFGVLNLADVSKHSNRVKAIEQEARQMQLEAEQKMKPLKDEMTEIQRRLTEEKDKLKPEEKQKLEADLKAKFEAFQSEQDALRTKIGFRQKSVQNAIFSQLKDVVKKVATAEGLTIVFYSQAFALAEGVPDISEKVAKELDALPAPESKPN
jgi:Skp family chaperone for outer membrane proteins